MPGGVVVVISPAILVRFLATSVFQIIVAIDRSPEICRATIYSRR